MKETNNMDSLIRDLDTLGVQDEIVMNIITNGERNNSNEYQALLEWNDTNKNKVLRVSGYVVNMIGVTVNIVIEFSNNSHFRISSSDFDKLVMDIIYPGKIYPGKNNKMTMAKEEELFVPDDIISLTRQEGESYIKKILRLYDYYLNNIIK